MHIPVINERYPETGGNKLAAAYIRDQFTQPGLRADFVTPGRPAEHGAMKQGDVPAIFMIPHILFMFVAILFSNLTGIMELFKDPAYLRFMKLTFWTLLVGGLILGPVIQNYALSHIIFSVNFRLVRKIKIYCPAMQHKVIKIVFKVVL